MVAGDVFLELRGIRGVEFHLEVERPGLDFHELGYSLVEVEPVARVVPVGVD